ncbi:MAG: acetylglutamate kinase [Chloroflexi bacterium]|nr:acetylglutamate kinase [Chloroflexota bacterium]
MTKPRVLLKVGGAELAPGPELDTLIGVILKLAKERQLVIVHGGGPEIAAWQARLGITVQTIDGLRVTDAASLQIAEMVLSGAVNKRLSARLNTAGLRAVGLSGVDGGLLHAVKIEHPKGDLGLVGEVVEVNCVLLESLLSDGYVLVISPISGSASGQTLNVNADSAALAIGRALQPDEAIFLTNVAGVMADGALLPELDERTAHQLTADGVITGGMIPKVQAALEGLAAGIRRVKITNLAGLAAASGTWIISNKGA